jgi:hypothetical protein
MKFTFTMSCGHTEDIEVADPKKYLRIDREYYKKQGLCSACWAKLHEQREQERQLRAKPN